MDPSFKFQKTIRDNASDLQNYMLDLKNWEEGAKKKERNEVYGLDKNEKDKEKKIVVTKSDVEYVKGAFEDGCRLMKNKKWELAEASFSKAIRKYNKNPAFFIKRAKCYLKMNKADQAEQDCTKALAIDPKILKAKFIRSQAREMKGNLKGACLDVQDILILDPPNQMAANILNRLKPLYSESLKKEGYQIDEEDENDSNKTAHSAKVDSFLESIAGSEEPPEDNVPCEERIQIANAEKEKGNQFVKLQKWEDAKEAYSKAIELNPNDPIFYANRALCFLKTNEAHRAIIDCGLALKKNPRYVKVYMRRAAAKKSIGDLWGARSDVKQVLSLEQNNSQAKSDLEELNLLIEKNIFNKTPVAAPQQASKPVMAEKPTPVKKQEENTPVNKSQGFITLLPVNKPVHLRSKKPLKRIPITFVDDSQPGNITKPPSESPSANRIFEQTKKEVIDKEPEKKEKVKKSIFTLSNGDSKTFKKQCFEKEITVQKEVELKTAEIDQMQELYSSCQKEFTYVFPVNKKPHLRSKKPLVRIPIKIV